MSTSPTRHRFRKAGALALMPQAWGGEFDEFPAGAKAPFVVEGAAAVVDVFGPLVHRPSSFFDLFCDSYGAIRKRVDAAFADVGTKAVVMRFDSPGGDVAGCFDLAREIRAIASASNKPLVAFVDATCGSAAYALATSAEEIVVTKTGVVGSIGVINALASQAKLDQAIGIDVAVVASGTRKTDNHPHVPISDDAVAALKGHVDELADVFFALVEDHRGIPAAAVQALDGAIAFGDRAVAAGLADRVSTWSEVVAGLAGAETAMKNKATKYDEAIGALRAAAEGEDEDAKKAKQALKAIDGGDDDGEKDKEADDAKKAADEKKDAEARAAKAEDDEKKDAEAKAMATNAVTMARELQELKAANAARDAAEAKAKIETQRSSLFAKRPDFSAAQRKTLASVSLAELEEAVEKWPRVNVAPGAAAAAMTPGGTRADDSRAPVSRVHECSPEEQEILAKLDAKAKTETKATVRGNVLQMPAMISQADAAARLKELEALQKGTV